MGSNTGKKLFTNVREPYKRKEHNFMGSNTEQSDIAIAILVNSAPILF